LKLLAASPTFFREPKYGFGSNHEAGERIHYSRIGQLAVRFEVIRRDLDMLATCSAAQEIAGILR